MAFSQDGLNPGADPSVGDKAPLFSYETSDNVSTVEGGGYFDAASDQLPSSGFILADMGDENALYRFSVSSGSVSLDANVSLTSTL